MDGVLIVDKPQGPTSHDVVVEVRRLTGDRKIGHGGTLDPLATGVLVLLLGRARRLTRFVQGGNKTYLCTIRFGVRTTTDDIDGEVMEERPAETDLPKVKSALEGLVGTHPQTPPAYSAVKVAGRPLHRSARAGEKAVAPPREVTVYSLDIIDLRVGDFPEADVRVVCSKGTYVRSLARDAGEKTGSGACVAALRREVSGAFTLADAHSLDELHQHAGSGRLDDDLLPLEAALGDMPRATLHDEWVERVSHGVKPGLVDAGPPTRPPAVGEPLALMSPAGRLVAIAEAGTSPRLDLVAVFAGAEGPTGNDK